MTVTMDRPPLEEALGIPGARSVSLLDPEGPSVLWWGGAAPPGEQQIGAVVTLAAAAAGLVMLTEPGDELGDVLLTSADAFHVMRLVTDGPLRVAHLTLRRTDANLAMARREFGALIEAYARRASSVPPAAAVAQIEAVPAPDPPARSLPRRSKADPDSTEKPFGDLPPGWLDLMGQPYSADEGVLTRVLTTLRHL
jgi:hypothetical protein